MSLSAPSGYPDWQRVANWDSPTLIHEANVSLSTVYESPLLDVSRFGYLAGSMLPAAGNVSVNLNWYADSIASILVGVRQFQLSNSINHVAQLGIPNMGPYVQVVASALGAGSQTFTASIFATNRYHPIPLIPELPVVIDEQGVSVPNNSTVTFYPQDYYAGPIGIWGQGTQQNSVLVQYLNGNNVWSDMYVDTYAASAVFFIGIIMPMSAWRMQVANNNTTALTMFLSAVPSQTGSG